MGAIVQSDTTKASDLILDYILNSCIIGHLTSVQLASEHLAGWIGLQGPGQGSSFVRKALGPKKD